MVEQSIFLSAIEAWKRLGFFDVILPFMLIFSVTFGILERTKIFGEKGYFINTLVSFSIAMISVFASWTIGFFTGFLPWVGIISVVIVCFMILASMFFTDLETLLKSKWIRAGGVLMVVISLFFVTVNIFVPDWYSAWEQLPFSPTDMWAIMFFILFLVILFVISRSTGGTSSK